MLSKFLLPILFVIIFLQSEAYQPLAWCPSLTHIRCKDGIECIPKSWMCDGKVDCSDSSDEISRICLQRPKFNKLQLKSISTNLKCPSPWFKCVDSSRCLSPDLVCNGFKNCRDGSDEREHCHVLNHQLIRSSNSSVIYKK